MQSLAWRAGVVLGCGVHASTVHTGTCRLAVWRYRDLWGIPGGIQRGPVAEAWRYVYFGRLPPCTVLEAENGHALTFRPRDRVKRTPREVDLGEPSSSQRFGAALEKSLKMTPKTCPNRECAKTAR